MAVGTVRQGHVHMMVDVVGFGPVGSRVAGLATRPGGMGMALFIGPAEGSGLTKSLPLPLLDLLLQSLHRSLGLLERGILLLVLLPELSVLYGQRDESIVSPLARWPQLRQLRQVIGRAKAHKAQQRCGTSLTTGQR